MPNSLIFVVILAVWAAYLIQHWIRRRDHVATAKSVDRFSEAMRVLERRQSMPRADLSAPAPRSYSVSLTRPAHPEVVVKRAQHGAAPVRAPRPAASRRRIARPSVAALRATALALGVIVLVGGITGSVTHLVGWWGAAIGVAGLLLALTFVRFSVGSAQRRATSPVRAGRQVERPTAAKRPSRTDRPTAAKRPSRTDRPAARRARDSRPAVHAVRPAHGHTDAVPAAPAQTLVESADVELYDVAAVDPAPALVPVMEPLPPVAQSAAQDAPGSWSPVPVPPPTYTLKARADRGSHSSTGAVPERTAQRVTTVEDLPFDGNALALDEEFEELPAVHRVV